MLKIRVEPYKGLFTPHIAFEKEIRYEESAEKETFTDVHIENKDYNLRVAFKFLTVD